MPTVITFRPNDANKKMLAIAAAAGLSITDLMNEAVAANGPQVLKELTKKARRKLDDLDEILGTKA